MCRQVINIAMILLFTASVCLATGTTSEPEADDQGKLAELRSKLALLQVEVEIAKQNNELEKLKNGEQPFSSAGSMPESLPVPPNFASLPVPQAPLPPSMTVVSVVGMKSGQYRATIETPSGVFVVEKGQKVGKATVMKIDLDEVVIKENGSTSKLPFKGI